MPPRVTYWTGIWEPRREALSGQADRLRRELAPGAPVVSFSAGQRSRLGIRDGVVRLSGRRWLLLRLLGAGVEPRGEVTHVLGGIGSWHLLRAVGRRPVLLTAAVRGRAHEQLRKVAMFAAETGELAEELAAAGVDRSRIRVVPPGVDLGAGPLPPRVGGPFELLFASSPADPAEIGPRGIPLLFDLARAVPDVRITLLWRLWGNLPGSRRQLESLSPPGNVRVVEGDVGDMTAAYARADATVCFFAPGAGKSCPNSVVEGLAVGRPALLTAGVGIAPLVAAEDAGCVGEARVEALVTALERLRADPAGYRQRARQSAERHFDRERMIATYAELYRELRDRR